jgi:NAD(P)-dependent dehydrogenase (short-subunit alcohol dehydrogenase family)
MRFERKVAIVTGGASGIGKAAVLRFIEEGASVVCVDVNEALGHALLETRTSDRLIFCQTDITSEDDVVRMVVQTLAAFGRIDVLVNNAAIFILKSIDATVEDWERMLRVNILGQALVTKHVVEHMKQRRSGNIVNLGSISAVIAQENQLTYNVTKAAVLAMTRCLALDLKEFGIRANTVSPGWVMTENVENLLYRERGWDDEEIRRNVGNLHLAGRLSTPAEIAAAIVWLASDDASFVNGANLMVDGGYTAV